MKKNNPLVSVIMSEYNTDVKLLKESIYSIINQSYKNLELILIDDCGKNDVLKIVEEFNDKRIKVYKNERNQGLVFSLNKAISLSTGKYIARMDTDDFSYEKRIEVEVDFLEKNKNIDLVSANIDYYDGKIIWGKTKKSGFLSRTDLLNGTTINHPTVMMKKSILVDNNGYKNFNRCEDYALWIELYSKNYKLYILPDVLLRYHLSLDDYKKRGLKSRKGFFKLLRTEYKKLKPSIFCILKIYLKNFLAAILPAKLMFNYHKKKANFYEK